MKYNDKNNDLEKDWIDLNINDNNEKIISLKKIV